MTELGIIMVFLGTWVLGFVAFILIFAFFSKDEPKAINKDTAQAILFYSFILSLGCACLVAAHLCGVI